MNLTLRRLQIVSLLPLFAAMAFLLVLAVVGAVGCAAESTKVTPNEAGSSSSAPPNTAGVIGMSPTEASTITMERALHFAGPNDTDVLVPAGSYQAQAGDASQIKLVAKDQMTPLILAAIPMTHEEKIEMPSARLVAGEEDSQHLLLLTPGGTGLAAVGSESGVGSRGLSVAALGSLKVTPATSVLAVLRAPTGGWVNPGGRFIPSDSLPVGKKHRGGSPMNWGGSPTVAYACRGKLGPSTFVGSIFFPSESCFTAAGKIDSFEILTPVWQYANNGMIPDNAYPTDGAYPTGGPLYFCRAFYDGGKIPGKVGNGLKGCSIGYKGKEVIVPGYEVLMLSFVRTTPNVTATPDTYIRAVYGGSSLYVDHLCYVKYQQVTNPGRFNLNQNACVIGWSGQEVLVSQFNIVEADLRAMPPDAYTLMGGKNERGRLYPVCRFLHDNGETEIGYLDPDMGTHNDPGPCNFMYSNGATGREPFNATQGFHDVYKVWTPGWDPVVK